MRIGLIGMGKMGTEIEKVAIQRGHDVTIRIDSSNIKQYMKFGIDEADVMIDFSTPHVVLDHIHWCIREHIPLVVGTTGWHTYIQEVKELTLANDGALIYGSNFSVGVNIFFALNTYLAQIMRDFPEYQPQILEIHHTQKLDAPSGTAISLAQQIIKELPRKKKWVNKKSVLPDELEIISERTEDVPGTHAILYQSEIDSIEISHIAHNRKGFAIGAVLAAEWIFYKKGFYEVREMFSFNR